MAKWYGVIGYVETVETEPGIWDEVVTERQYYGDLTRNTRRLESSSDSTNNNINISNQISIVADPYANGHIFAMRYIEIMGTKWRITDVEVQYPRLILSVGGVYNG